MEMIGDGFSALQDYSNAIIYYRNIIRKKPKNLAILNKLAKLYLLNKNHEKAITLMEQLRVLSPNNIKRLCQLGAAYLDTNQAKAAEEAFGSANRMDQDNPEARDGMGKALFSQGKFSKAVGFLRETEKAAEMSSYFNNLGIALVRQKRYQEAARLYINALNMLPSHEKEYLLLFNIGLSFKKDFNLEKAAGFFKSSSEKKLGFQKALTNLREVYENVASEQGEASFDAWLENVNVGVVQDVINELADSEDLDLSEETLHEVDQVDDVEEEMVDIAG